MSKPKIEPKTVEIGSNQPATLVKMFGPLIFADLRITADSESGDWIIERMWIEKGEFIPWARIPGQIEREFANDPFNENTETHVSTE